MASEPRIIAVSRTTHRIIGGAGLLMVVAAWPTIPADQGASMYIADAKRLTHDGAKKMMTVAVEAAHKAGIAVSCCIVDAGGHGNQGLSLCGNGVGKFGHGVLQ